jgi:hypothetical protein
VLTVRAGVRYGSTRAGACGAASDSADQSGLISSHPGAAGGEKKTGGRQSQILVVLHLQPPAKKITASKIRAKVVHSFRVVKKILHSLPFLCHLQNRPHRLSRGPKKGPFGSRTICISVIVAEAGGNGSGGVGGFRKHQAL